MPCWHHNQVVKLIHQVHLVDVVMVVELYHAYIMAKQITPLITIGKVWQTPHTKVVDSALPSLPHQQSVPPAHTQMIPQIETFMSTTSASTPAISMSSIASLATYGISSSDSWVLDSGVTSQVIITYFLPLPQVITDQSQLLMFPMCQLGEQDMFPLLPPLLYYSTGHCQFAIYLRSH